MWITTWDQVQNLVLPLGLPGRTTANWDHKCEKLKDEFKEQNVEQDSRLTYYTGGPCVLFQGATPYIEYNRWTT